MRADHVPEVVGIYGHSFRGGFLARLGPDFLNLMFSAFMEGEPRECSLVCVDGENRIVGFVCGSKDRAAYLRSFLRSYWLKALPVLIRAASRDRGITLAVAQRIWLNRTALSGLVVRPGHGKSSNLPAASLMTVAVATTSRDQGLGAGLVGAFMDEMRTRGVRTVRLAVSEENSKARHLYERLGWEPWAAPTGARNRSLYYVRLL